MSSSLKIFSGNAHPSLANEICSHLQKPLGEASIGTFPDGETAVQIHENIRGADVFFVQPTCAPANQQLMELLIMIDAAKRASASRITAVIPFYGYARQDRKDKPRVPITAKLVANLLVAAGANRILTIDLHSQQISGFFDIPVDHIFAATVFYKYLEKYRNEDLVICCPDVGGMKMAAAYANVLKLPLAVMAKRRIDADTVEAIDIIGDIKDRNILLVDDMTETAGTLIAAAKLLRKQGAKTIRAAVTHGVLNEKGYERFKDGLIDELITTNTTPVQQKDLPITILSVAPLLAEAITRIHQNESVTGLFQLKRY